MPGWAARYCCRINGNNLIDEVGPNEPIRNVPRFMPRASAASWRRVLPEERFDTVALIEDQMVALLPADHPLAVHDSLNLKDLCAFPFVLTEAGSSELVSRLFTAARLTPNIRYRCSQLISTLDVVARGDGVTVVAEGSLPNQSDSRYVKKPLSPTVVRQVGLAVLDRRQASPATLAFIELAASLDLR